MNNEAGQMDQRPAKGVSVLAHPMAELIPAAIGALGMAYCAEGYQTSKEFHDALWAGLAVALPMIALVKLLMRRYRDFYADFFTTPLWDRPAWGKTNQLGILPVYLVIVAQFTLDHFRYGLGHMALPIFCILHILVYPEQKALWLAAKERVADMKARSQSDGDHSV